MLTLYHILLGLLGLSLIVLIHEFGHFLAARACGVTVERLCLFLGKPLLSWYWGGVEFGIAWLPLGGYCKMKDEGLAALQGKDAQSATAGSLQRPLKGSFQAASPPQRIFIAAAGPLINIVFAFVVLWSFQVSGYREWRESNKILVPRTAGRAQVVQSPSPAELAGLQDGDTILAIGTTQIASFQDIRTTVMLNAGKPLKVEYLRGSQKYSSQITPASTASGLGWIGITTWLDCVVKSVKPSSSAAAKGLRPGDRLYSAGGQPVQNLNAVLERLRAEPQEEFSLLFEQQGSKKLQLFSKDLQDIRFQEAARVPGKNVFAAGLGVLRELKSVVLLQFLALKRLLSGALNVRSSLAGPIQISDQIGQVVSASDGSFAERWYSIWQILSLISLMIALANLLPFAALDGGQILLFSLEWLLQGRLPKAFIRGYQIAGSALVFVLMLFVLGLEFLHYFNF